MKKIYLFSVLIPLLSACSSDSPDRGKDNNQTPDTPEINNPVRVENPIRLSAEEENARDAYNVFAVQLAEQALNSDQNTCISPFGVYQVLSMAANGDKGETGIKMIELLSNCNANVSLEDFNSYNRTMTQGLINTAKYVTLTSANSVWYADGLEIEDSFRSLLGDYYSSDFFAANLPSRECMEAINGWCKENTAGMIEKYLSEPLDPNTIVEIFNALYFHGPWVNPFELKDTKPGLFHNLNGNVSTVQMMHGGGMELYLDRESYTVVSKQFAGPAFDMLFILPAAGGTLRSVTENIRTIVNDFNSNNSLTEMEITMPKFEVNPVLDLRDMLGAMGFDFMFTSGFDSIIKGMTVPPSQVRQQLKFELAEEGVSAAAVTEMGMLGFNGENTEPLKITLDRPFIYLIREKATGTILFIGQQTGF